MAKKMTKAEMFKAIMDKYELSNAEVEFIEHEIELIEKKNASRKPTKVQIENEDIKTAILDYMSDSKVYTVTDIQKALGIDSNQKANALIRQLRDAGKIERTLIKGRAYFNKAQSVGV